MQLNPICTYYDNLGGRPVLGYGDESECCVFLKIRIIGFTFRRFMTIYLCTYLVNVESVATLLTCNESEI